MEDLEQVKFFLRDPENNAGDFESSDAVIWIDWGEEDEYILRYFNNHLPEDRKIRFEVADSDTERGFDIILEKDGTRTPIPYDDDSASRDVTLIAAQEYLSPAYQIRWYADSLGSDTLGFCLLPSGEWEALEREFGAEKVQFHFAPISPDSRMFDLDMDEIFDLLDKRGI